MYSQALKSDQPTAELESRFWKMDLVTRRTKRRSILGKGRSSLKLGLAPGIIPGSGGINGSDEKKVGSSEKKTSAVGGDAVKARFAPGNPFAGILKESIGSLEENEEPSSGPSSSSEGSARKLLQEDPDITGVFFMDDVESVKKRQLDLNKKHGGFEEMLTGSSQTSKSHTVSCNLMTKSPFTAKQPLKDHNFRLNRATEARALSITRARAGSVIKKRIEAEMMKSSRTAEKARQPVSLSSPVKPVLKSSTREKNIEAACALSPSAASSSLGSVSALSSSYADNCTESLRRSLSVDDVSKSRPESTSYGAARRAASELHFEEMCKTRTESVYSTNMLDGSNMFASKRNRASLANEPQPPPNRHTSISSRSTTEQSIKSKGRLSMALYSSDQTTASNTKKSRPSIMSDFIINQNTNRSSVDLFSDNRSTSPIRRDIANSLVKTTDVRTNTKDESIDSNKKLKTCENVNRTLVFDDEENDDDTETFVYNESVCNETVVGDVSVDKIKKLSVIEEEESAKKASLTDDNDASLLEITMRGDNSEGSNHTSGGVDYSFARKVDEKIGAILERRQELLKWNEAFERRQMELVEEMRRKQNEFIKQQNERINAFESLQKCFTQDQNNRITALFDDIASLTCDLNGAGISLNDPAFKHDDDVFHTALKNPPNTEKMVATSSSRRSPSKNHSNLIYSQLKSDFKCLKTPKASAKKSTSNDLNRTILTPHSMSVCVQEQVSLLFDA